MSVSMIEVERALNTIASHNDRMAQLRASRSAVYSYGQYGGVIYRDIFQQESYLYNELVRAKTTIRRAQMEAKWPILKLLDIYNWPAP